MWPSQPESWAGALPQAATSGWPQPQPQLLSRQRPSKSSKVFAPVAEQTDSGGTAAAGTGARRPAALPAAPPSRSVRQQQSPSRALGMVPHLVESCQDIVKDGLVVRWQPSEEALPQWWEATRHTKQALQKIGQPETVRKQAPAKIVDRKTTRQRNDRLGLRPEERKQLQSERNRQTARLAAARRKQETVELEGLVRAPTSAACSHLAAQRLALWTR